MSAALSPLAIVLLAQTAAPDAASQAQAFYVLGGIVALAVMGNQIMGALISWRKLKGTDPQDDRRYASKAEHDALRDEVVGIKADFSNLSRTINIQFNDLQRSIGRLEGKIDDKKPPGGSRG